MPSPTAHLKLVEEGPRPVLALQGRLDAIGAGQLWRPAIQAAQRTRGRALALDLHDVGFCDLSGATLLAAIDTAHGGIAETLGASERVADLLRRAQEAGRQRPGSPAEPAGVHRPAADPLTGTVQSIEFLGEAALALLALPRRRRMFRLATMAQQAEQAGIRSLPLVTLLGYLMGLILAFQSAVPMRQFGADLWVVNLVVISLLRELGALLAAVIMAGRTGSAFAAEIGTMKVNEELDALSTMGLHPMTMLVLPRLAAVMLVLPAMTLALELAGLCGMATAMLGFGFPLSAIAIQVQSAAKLSDLLGGLFKALVFGVTVAAIGCRAGMTTGVGPRAVGLAATAAVVGGIVATIILDGIFALLFYRLGL